jgi:glycosyltransferase involved in cell wall biosynthesis
MYELAQELNARGFDITIYSLDRAAVSGDIKFWQSFPMKKTLGPISSVFFSFSTMLKILGKQKFDLIHGTMVPSTCFLLSLFNKVCTNKIPLVLTSNGMAFKERQFCGVSTASDMALKFLSWPIQEFMDRLSIRGSSHIVAVSQENKRNLMDSWNMVEDQISVIPPGIFTKNFRNSWHLESENTTFKSLYVGRLVSRKRVHLLLDLAKILELSIPNYKLIIVGEGYLKEKLKKQIQLLNLEKTVSLLGNISHQRLVQLLHNSNVFLFPSVYEGFGISVLEALACGLPVVASEIPAALYAREHNAGYIVNWHESQEVAKLICSLSKDKDLNDTLSNNAFELSAKFDWSNIANNYIKVYESIGR